MMGRLFNIGFGNLVNSDKILCVIGPDSAPAKRMVQHCREEGRLVDATQGRRTKSVIVTETGTVILSALTPETLQGRCNSGGMERGEGE